MILDQQPATDDVWLAAQLQPGRERVITFFVPRTDEQIIAQLQQAALRHSPSEAARKLTTLAPSGLTQGLARSTVAFHGTGITQKEVFTPRIVDVAPTLLWLLDVPFEPTSKDGRVLPEIREMRPTESTPR